MKLLIAADGPTLESLVAKRFGHALSYLTVDSDSKELLAVRSGGQVSRTMIIRAAATAGITTVITGGIGPQAYALLSTNNMRAVHAREMTAGEAVDKFSRGELKVLDVETLRQTAEEHELHRKEHRQQVKTGKHASPKSGITPVTPRGKHHLQQFSGRGH